jgi:hypothetical protein
MHKHLPENYVFPSMLRAIGDTIISQNIYFNIKTAFYRNISSILQTLDTDFDIILNVDELTSIYNLIKTNTIISNEKFYDSHSVYFLRQPVHSKIPLNGKNFLVFEIPEDSNLLQYSPDSRPLVAGEISLDYAKGLIVEVSQEEKTREVLAKNNKHNLWLETYKSA